MKTLALAALPVGLAIMLLLVRQQPSLPIQSPPTSIQPIPIPYVMVSSPNVNAPSGVMAIVPNKAGISPNAAASLAKFARGQFRSVKSWKAMHIYVFSNLSSANRFNTYQTPRMQRPLRTVDYAALKKLWPSVLAVYEYWKGQEKVLHPALNPSGWWRALK